MSINFTEPIEWGQIFFDMGFTLGIFFVVIFILVVRSTLREYKQNSKQIKRDIRSLEYKINKLTKRKNNE